MDKKTRRIPPARFERNLTDLYHAAARI